MTGTFSLQFIASFFPLCCIPSEAGSSPGVQAAASDSSSSQECDLVREGKSKELSPQLTDFVCLNVTNPRIDSLNIHPYHI